jgi:hypothetical protein
VTKYEVLTTKYELEVAARYFVLRTS